MSTRVWEAVKSRWDSQSLGTVFTGGIWFIRPKNYATYPRVIFTPISNTTHAWTSTSEIRSQSFQMTIHYNAADSTDPVSALGTLMRTLDTAMCFAPLAISSSAGHVIEIRRSRDDIMRDPESDTLYMGQIDYEVLRMAPVNYSPS